MAYGGWIRSQVQMGPYGSYTQANGLAAVDNVLNALASMAGWSVKRAAWNYGNDAIIGVCQHTSGAEWALLLFGPSVNWGAIYDPGNARPGGSAPSPSHANTIGCAYIPPGKGSFDTNVSPQDPAWILPTPGLVFRLYPLHANNWLVRFIGSMWSGGYHYLTLQVRGDDIQVAWQHEANTALDIDQWRFYGTGFGTLAHGPTNDTNAEVFIAYADDSPLWSDAPVIDFYNAAETVILEGTRVDPSAYLSGTYTVGPPYNGVQLEAINDLGEGAVYGTDGMKGKITDDLLILTPDGALPKATWNSETHFHLRGGLWVGSDPGNPVWI